MKRTLIMLLVTGMSLIMNLPVQAADPKYRIVDIPKELLANAKAVVRNEGVVFELKSVNNAVKTVSCAISVINENGYPMGYLMIPYDRFTTVRKIKGSIYNTNGELVRRFTDNDIIDHSAISGISVYDDHRVKFIDPDYRIYPFTVEYSYEISYTGMNNYPEWMVMHDYNVSVEKSRYTVVVAEGLKFRYFESNLPQTVTMGTSDGNSTYSWQAVLLPAILPEPFCRPVMEYTPVLYTAPSDFEMDGFAGNADSWENFGRWIYDLNKGRNEFEPEAKSRFMGMVSGAKNDEEKIRILYDYLQQNTRYVSIQVGIGSWQPFEASTVYENGYGDCKALVNFMKSMLDAVGIYSIYTLVRAGDDAPRLVTAFPSNQFNHVILCVPGNNDTIWLECTNQHIPFGYLGSFTDDRDVLLITEKGGIIAHSRKYSQKQNNITRKAVVDLDPSGNGRAEILSSYSGMFYDEISPILYQGESDRKKIIASGLSIPSFSLQECNYSEERSDLPWIEERLKLDLPNYYTNMGDRAILPLNLMNEPGQVITSIFDRVSDISIRRASTVTDTIIYILPPGYGPDKIPPPADFKSTFGEYHSSAVAEGNRVVYARSLLMNKGDFPKTEIDAFIAFMEKIAKQDGVKCSLKKVE